MNRTFFSVWACLLFGGMFFVLAVRADTNSSPSGALKYGLYIHYGLPTFTRPDEQGEIPPTRFNPASINIKSWAHTAREAGMTFAVLTVKHDSGFCLWDSANYTYDVASSPFKGDIIGDFIKACKNEGILPGAHYSILDAHNGCMPGGPVTELYFNLVKQQIEELHTKYPALRAQIFGGSFRLSPAQWNELVQLVHRLNPGCVILDKDHEPKCQFASVNPGWMWRLGEPWPPKLNPVGRLLRRFWEAHAAGQSFILNAGPGPLGNIQPGPFASLMEMKRLIALGPLRADVPEPPKQTQTPPALRVGAPDSENWHMEYGPAQRVWVTSRAILHSPQAKIRECVLSAAMPGDFEMQHPLQTILTVNGQVFPSQQDGQRLSARIPAVSAADHSTIEASVSHEITFVGRHLKSGPASGPPPAVDPAVLQEALRETGSLDFKSLAFSTWLVEQNLKLQAGETPIAFARRACQFVHRKLTWVYPPPRVKLSVACHFAAGDCGSYSQLFVGIMRANRIPAREMWGCWVRTDAGPLPSAGHVRSEFYANGVGWLPVDANNNQFGSEDANFLVLAEQGRIHLDPIGGAGVKSATQLWLTSTLMNTAPCMAAAK